MTRVVVAGWGQTLRGDDGAGWQVAEEVAACWGQRVTVFQAVHPLPEWAPVLASADHAYLVDASAELAGDDLLVTLLAPSDEPGASAGHGLDAAGLLGLAAVLYGRAPSTHLILLPAARFSVGEVLSPRAAQGVRDAVGWLNRALAGTLARSPTGY